MQQRCQWSAAEAGVTSALRLHAATNAYLSMKHDVAKQAANGMRSKMWTRKFFDQCISLAVVTISDGEGEIDILVRPGIWPGDVCAPRIFVKQRVQLFNQDWKF